MRRALLLLIAVLPSFSPALAQEDVVLEVIPAEGVYAGASMSSFVFLPGISGHLGIKGLGTEGFGVRLDVGGIFPAILSVAASGLFELPVSAGNAFYVGGGPRLLVLGETAAGGPPILWPAVGIVVGGTFDLDARFGLFAEFRGDAVFDTEGGTVIFAPSLGVGVIFYLR